MMSQVYRYPVFDLVMEQLVPVLRQWGPLLLVMMVLNALLPRRRRRAG